MLDLCKLGRSTKRRLSRSVGSAKSGAYSIIPCNVPARLIMPSRPITIPFSLRPTALLAIHTYHCWLSENVGRYVPNHLTLPTPVELVAFGDSKKDAVARPDFDCAGSTGIRDHLSMESGHDWLPSQLQELTGRFAIPSLRAALEHFS